MIEKRAELYSSELYGRIVPFWLDHAPDRESGGHFSCLTGDGTVFDTDKFLWMQGRYLWMSSFLASRPGGGKLAERCAAEACRAAGFLLRYGRNDGGEWYFALERGGKPRVEAYNIFTDVFCMLGLAEFASIDSYPASEPDLRRRAADAALQSRRIIDGRRLNPKGRFSKASGGSRSYLPLNRPMIDLNSALVLDRSVLADKIGRSSLRTEAVEAAAGIITYHLDTEAQLLRERVGPGGEYLKSNMEGRLLTPGHGLETLSFIIEAVKHWGSTFTDAVEARPAVAAKLDAAGADSLATLLADAVLWVLRKGWDEEQGGIFYYMDSEGFPPDKLEWDMKLWWVHAESALAALSAWELCGSEELFGWYERIHGYMWNNFRREDSGEWYGYLSRDGRPTADLAGGKWKGFFHLPRALYRMINILEYVR